MCCTSLSVHNVRGHLMGVSSCCLEKRCRRLPDNVCVLRRLTFVQRERTAKSSPVCLQTRRSRDFRVRSHHPARRALFRIGSKQRWLRHRVAARVLQSTVSARAGRARVENKALGEDRRLAFESLAFRKTVLDASLRRRPYIAINCDENGALAEKSVSRFGH